MLLLVVSLSLCWTMSTRAKNSRSHGYLYDMLSMIFWFVWGEDTGVVTRLDIYHLAGAAGSWWYWHCDCDQDQDQEDHYYWDFVNTSSSSEIAPQMTPAGPIRYTQHHTWPVLTIHGYWLYACFRSILPIYCWVDNKNALSEAKPSKQQAACEYEWQVCFRVPGVVQPVASGLLLHSLWSLASSLQIPPTPPLFCGDYMCWHPPLPWPFPSR